MEDNSFNIQPYEIIKYVTAILTSNKIFFCVCAWYLYKWLLKPLNYIKGLDEVGWLENNKNCNTRVLGKIPPVYPNGWFVVAESDDLKIGGVMYVTALGENLAVFRTRDGQAKVLDAYCPHLGANMAVGGKVVGDCIQCPFHLWKFNGSTGLCSSIPNNEKIPKNAKVRSWKTFEANGFIFIWYHAEGDEPKWYPEDISEINNRKFTYFGRNQYHIKCHIQEVPENGSDMAHFKALHETAPMCGGDIRYHQKTIFKFFRHCWRATWEPCTESGKQHVGLATLNHHITLFGSLEVGKCYIRAYQMGPGYVALHVDTGLGPIILLQSVTPVEPLVQKVIHRVYGPAYLFLYARLFLLAECYMFERDMMVWNNKTYLDQPIYTREDKCIGKFRRWYQQFYTEHSKTYAMAKEGLDW